MQGLLYVGNEVVHGLQSYGQSDGGLSHVHLLQLSLGEESEDGGGGVDGQRAVVEEVGGAVDELQPVEEPEARLLGSQVDGKHGAGGGPELSAGQRVVGVVVQSDVVDAPYLSPLAQRLGQGQCVGGLPLVAHVERLQSQRLLVGGLGCHVGAEVEQQLILQALVQLGERAVVDDQSAQRRAAAGDVLGAGHHLDVDAQLVERGLGEGDDSGVGNDGNALGVGYLGNGPQVGHLQLGVGDDFEEDARRLLVDSLPDGLQVGEVAQPGLHTEAQQRIGDEGQRVAEEVARGDDALALGADGQQGVADGCHARVEGRHVGGSRQCTDALLQVGDGGVFHAGVVGCLDAVAEGVGHLLCVLELERHIIINRYGQRPVHVGAHKRRIDGCGLFLHFLVSFLIYRTPRGRRCRRGWRT